MYIIQEGEGGSAIKRLRDYFAAQAMSGILASCTNEDPFPRDEKLAKWCYEFADAMLAERAKPPKIPTPDSVVEAKKPPLDGEK